MTGPLLLAAPCHLPDDAPTFGKEMKRRGYKTVLSGKWHLGHHSWKHTPVEHGFDEFWGVLNCCAAYYSKSYYHPLFGHKIDWRNNTEAVAPAPQEHASELFADFLVDIIEKTPRDTPLFLMFTLTAPHSPLQSETRHKKMCAHVKTDRRRTFCGLMMSVDEAVGRVRGAMENAGRWDESIVTFFNDNGGNVWEGGRNYPFRGGKMSSFEGGVRATGLIKFPKSEQERLPSDFRGLSHVADVMPTILGYIDRSSSSSFSSNTPFPSGDAELGRGYDLSLPLFNVTEPQREDVLLQYEPSTDRLGYRWGDWKLVSGAIGDPRRFYEPTSDMSWIGDSFHDKVAELIMHWQHGFDEDASGTMDETVREVSVTVQEYWRNLFGFVSSALGFSGGDGDGNGEGRRTLLYNLSSDPYEDEDVAAANQEVVKTMLARVEKMERHFPENCDWFVMDRNIEFEKVEYVENGKSVVKEYHSPFVGDDAFDDYEPLLFNVNPARKYGTAAIVFLEIIIMILVASKALRLLGGIFFRGEGGGEKKKRE